MNTRLSDILNQIDFYGSTLGAASTFARPRSYDRKPKTAKNKNPGKQTRKIRNAK